ncbi:MAG: hypothetical protein AB1640_11780 [bacterium]
MKYSVAFHWANHADRDEIANEFFSRFATHIGTFPLSCDLSLALCRNESGDGLVHLFLDAEKYETMGQGGKEVWEIVNDFIEASGCPRPQGSDSISTRALADVRQSLAEVRVRILSSVKRKGGRVTSENRVSSLGGTSSLEAGKKWYQFWTRNSRRTSR